MGQHTRRESLTFSPRDAATDADLAWPFGVLDAIDGDDLRETAYEILFTSCRSLPGFGGRNALTYYSSDAGGEGGGSRPGSPVKGNGLGVAATSRTKRALGLKMLRRPVTRRPGSSGSNPSSPRGLAAPNVPSTSAFSLPVPAARPRRQMTSAEILKQQMKVTDASDNRLRKTLMRTLVGQTGRRPETIILPLELLRHLKASEFNDPHEYHLWQKRQLKVLEAGLILHPSIPLDKANTSAMRIRDIVLASEMKPLDTGKNSEAMKTLCNCAVSLSWRSLDSLTPDVCHWADGFPLNVHLYITLLNSIFDLKEEASVLDEIDELLELMKKTWTTLGVNRSIHNLCFTWVLFQQYVTTGQVEPDLLCATLAMLAEVANDAKKEDRAPIYVKMLSSTLISIKKWSEKRLLDYHGNFHGGTVGIMENLLPIVVSATKILEDIKSVGEEAEVDTEEEATDLMGNKVHQYIRSSLRIAFTKTLEKGKVDGMTVEVQEVSEALIQLAKETEDLAVKEKEIYSRVLKKWHPVAGGVAALTLHTCYATLLKQYLAGVSSLTSETIEILHRAGKLEKVLVQMVVEDSVDCEDGGKAIVREMVPYEVDSVILNLLKEWIQERLKKGKECLQRAKETETWNPKSKTEPYAQSAEEMIRLAREAVEDFLEIPIGVSVDLIQNLADGLASLFREYITYVASCGSKHSYIPILPPLTRCNRDSKFTKLWKIASPCRVGVDDAHLLGFGEGHHPRLSTSRGTQRLYIRLNTLHYLLNQLNSLDKTLSLSPQVVSSRRQMGCSSSYFDNTRKIIQDASHYVSEVAAYRLIFLDSNSVFYGSLYVGDVENARIQPALRTLKQNLTLLSAIVSERVQPLAVKEVMKASFEAFLMVLLAGGISRIFTRSDHEMIEEDFQSLKRVFSTFGEGLMAEDAVEREVETVEGVVALMGQSTEQLVEDFSIVACEASGIGVAGSGQKLPMPPTTGKWNRADPNTILRVLCYRNDTVANQFLKRTFQIAKRR